MTEDRSGKPLPPSFVREDERGVFIEIVNEGPWETIIQGHMQQGAVMGEHYHRECRAYFYVVSGLVQFRIRHVGEGTRKEVTLPARTGLYLLPYETHKITFLEEGDFMLLKSYRYDAAQPDTYHCPIDPAD